MQIHFENPGAGMARPAGGSNPVLPGPSAQTGAGFVALLAEEGWGVAEPPVLTHPPVLAVAEAAQVDQPGPVAAPPADPVRADGTGAVPVPPPMPVRRDERPIRSPLPENVSVPDFFEDSGLGGLPQDAGARTAGLTEDARNLPDQDPVAADLDTDAPQPALTPGSVLVPTVTPPVAAGHRGGVDASVPPTLEPMQPDARRSVTFKKDVNEAIEARHGREGVHHPNGGKAIEMAAPGTVDDGVGDRAKEPKTASDTAKMVEKSLPVQGNAFALTAAPPMGLSLPSAPGPTVSLRLPDGSDVAVFGHVERMGDVIAPLPTTAAPGIDEIAMDFPEGNPPISVRFASSPTAHADEAPQGTGAVTAVPANPVAPGSPLPQMPLSPSGQALWQENPQQENLTALAVATDAAREQPAPIAFNAPDPAGGEPVGPATAAPGMSTATARADLAPLPGPHEPRAVSFDDLPRMMPVLLKAQGAAGAVELRLQPADLGAISISMQPEADRVTVVIQADRPETAELLRRNADLLSQELKQGGFAQASISFAAGGQGGWGTGGQPEGQRTDHAGLGRDGHVASASPSSDRAARATADPALAGQGRLYLRL
ncbi:flagellar hook-length control protein FliK [Aliigemmobacter aestuarii]|nr:flagellar hook-length control protein FliK [Gemmobacter aestuarii]